MAHLKRRRRSGPFWNLNRICLLVIVIIFGSISALILSAVTAETGSFGQALGGALCPLVIMAIPLAILLRAGLKGRKSESVRTVIRPGVAPKPGFRDVSISSAQSLPRICIRCGVTTKRVTPLRYAGAHTDASPYDWSRIHPLLMIFLIWKFAFQVIMVKVWEMMERRWQKRRAESDGVTFRIPHCKGCASRNPIVQRHFDFHGRMMILEAHSEFDSNLQR